MKFVNFAGPLQLVSSFGWFLDIFGGPHHWSQLENWPVQRRATGVLRPAAERRAPLRPSLVLPISENQRRHVRNYHSKHVENIWNYLEIPGITIKMWNEPHQLERQAWFGYRIEVEWQQATGLGNQVEQTVVSWLGTSMQILSSLWERMRCWDAQNEMEPVQARRVTMWSEAVPPHCGAKSRPLPPVDAKCRTLCRTLHFFSSKPEVLSQVPVISG